MYKKNINTVYKDTRYETMCAYTYTLRILYENKKKLGQFLIVVSSWLI